MSVSQNHDVLERVVKLAAECGIEGGHDLESSQYVICFGLPDERTQEVYVGNASTEPDVRVIRVHSTCLILQKGLFSGVTKNMAVELLMLNEKLNFARYGIQEDQDSYIIVASYDLLLDYLSPKGFEAALECVALAADSYEAKFGQDVF